MIKQVACIIFVLFSVSSFAQSKCDTDANAEQRRVERDLAASAPIKTDTQAYIAWSKRLHEQLEDIAKKHEACRKTSQSSHKRDECITQVGRKRDMLELKYKKINLSAQEQTAFREEERQLLDERQACLQIK